jgi:hypothetical protein
MRLCTACQVHLVLFGFQAEGEPVKAELHYFRKPPNTFRAVASKTKIEILAGARRPREAQFHGDASHTRKSFLQPLYRLRSHELNFPHFRLLCPFRVCVSIETASEC